MFLNLDEYRNVTGISIDCPASRINITSIDIVIFEIKKMVLKNNTPCPNLNIRTYEKANQSEYEIEECKHILFKKWEPNINFSSPIFSISFSSSADKHFEKMKKIIGEYTV